MIKFRFHPHALRLGIAAAGVGLLGGISITALAQNRAQVVNVYSGRHYNTDKELYAQFTRQTGIRVNLIEGKDDGMIERLRREGSRSPADVLITVDAARLQRAKELNLFRPIQSAALNRDVPASLRDPGGQWFALTRRARPVMVNPAQVNPSLIRTYGDLARPALKGKLCMRDRSSVYSQSLTADVLQRAGKATTERWLKGMVANVKQPFFTSDTTMVRAVGQGSCGAAVANTYYLARLLTSDNAADKAAARKVRVVWVNPTHVNVTGGGVTRHSGNPEGGRRLLEFLSSPTSGEGYAAANNEYPVKGWGNNATLRSFGTFKASPVTIQQLGQRNREAVQLMQQAGWK
ncbi:MAG: extracellular solute-binding protein [Cyanobium sp. M30B3]|jgi:iron(III) transport system substrate-binding protein|nr:MAG: extracellular solute-binding protein [Cyanobium sp. M30B3]